MFPNKIRYGQKCVYLGCSINRKDNPENHFFYFPSRRIDICKQWVNNCGNAAIRKISFSRLCHRVLCGSHFPRCCFTNDMKNRLEKFAVPFPFTNGVSDVPSGKPSTPSWPLDYKRRSNSSEDARVNTLCSVVELPSTKRKPFFQYCNPRKKKNVASNTTSFTSVPATDTSSSAQDDSCDYTLKLSSERGKNNLDVNDDESVDGNDGDEEETIFSRQPFKIKVEPLPVCEEENLDCSPYDESTLETEDPLNIDHSLIDEISIPIKPLVGIQTYSSSSRKRDSALSSTDWHDKRKQKILKIVDKNVHNNSDDGERREHHELSFDDKSFLMSILPTMQELNKSQKNEFKLIVLKTLSRLLSRNTISCNSTSTGKNSVSSINSMQTSLQGVNSESKNSNKPTPFISIFPKNVVSGLELLQGKLISNNSAQPHIESFDTIPEKAKSSSILSADSTGGRQFSNKLSSSSALVSDHKESVNHIQDKTSSENLLLNTSTDRTKISSELTASIPISPAFRIKTENDDNQENTSSSDFLSADFTNENYILPETAPCILYGSPKSYTSDIKSSSKSKLKNIRRETFSMTNDITVDDIKLEPVDIKEEPLSGIYNDS